jgi:hypothetical protein
MKKCIRFKMVDMWKVSIKEMIVMKNLKRIRWFII